jgi:DNA (cytosine-5)-methyltransferase 1
MTDIVAAEIFCGVGGLAHGLRRAGIRVTLGIDADPTCGFAYEQNVGARFLEGDVRETSPSVVRRALTAGDVRVLTGCAPCQPFSEWNSRRSSHSAHGELLVDTFREWSVTIRPDIVAFENVPSVRGRDSYRSLIRELRALGYSIWDGIVDAHDYGVAQRRRRLVMLASRLSDSPPMPVKKPGRRPWTVRDAIGYLPSIASGDTSTEDPLHRSANLSPLNVRRIQASKPGGTWLDWPPRLRLDCHRNGSGQSYHDAYGRLSWDAPSSTITTKFFNYGSGRFGHPEQDRALSAREGALLQGFPWNFVFHERETQLSLTDVGRLIGNAIPVPLGEAIGRGIVRHVAAQRC